MEELIRFFKQHDGYGRMKDLKSQGIHTRTIARAVQENIIVKIKPGLYKLVNYPWNKYSSFIDIYKSKNNAVIFLLSALEYYDIITFNPSEVTVAVPHNTDKFDINYPPIYVYYFSNKIYSSGIQKVNTENGCFNIYSPEKSIADMFHYRNKLGEDIAMEALNNYLKKDSPNITKLREYAKICRVKTIMLPYLKAMVSTQSFPTN